MIGRIREETKMNEEIIRVLQICLNSLTTYGQHPIIESQVKQLIQKLQNDNIIPVENLVRRGVSPADAACGNFNKTIQGDHDGINT